MARYRLRFLLQEFDLHGNEVCIGRGSDCHITLEDPLVSRHHALIVLPEGAAPHFRDLESRNGSWVNGVKVQDITPLNHHDRIRIGTQELVFVVAEEQGQRMRETGFHTVCRACGKVYPKGSFCCPHCGAGTRQAEETFSGPIGQHGGRSWTFQLLGEFIERALNLGRAEEADRVMQRAQKEVDTWLGAGQSMRADDVALVSLYAIRLAVLVRGTAWIRWALFVHENTRTIMSHTVCSALLELDPTLMSDITPSVVRYLHAAQSWVQPWPEAVAQLAARYWPQQARSQ